MNTNTKRPGISLVMTLMLVLAFCGVPPPAQAVDLGWLSVGDDGMTGAASGYVMAWSLDSAAIVAWDCDGGWCDPGGTAPVGIITADGLPAGIVAGTPLAITLPDNMFPSGATVFFSVKGFDDAGNYGLLGNICRKTLPDIVRPATILDLF